MSKKVQHVKIDDTEFELMQLGGVEGLDVYDRLCKELGPIISNAIRTGLLEQNADTKVAVMVIEGLSTLPSDFKRELWTRFAGLSTVKAGSMMLALGDGVKLEKGGTFDQHFAGRFGHMTRWLLACLKWSFGDFLPGSAESTEATATQTQ